MKSWRSSCDRPTLHNFADGVAVVMLAAVRDPGLVAPEIARALEVQEVPDQSPQARLIGHLGKKSMLLVLDNFEQVLTAAPLVTEILQACPGLKALVTSRATLVDHSLLRPSDDVEGDTRLTMLETVREYAWERLEESGETEAIGARHAEAFLALAERAEAEREGPDTGRWLTRLEREHDNLRAALAWSLERAESGAALRLAAALAWFWENRAHWREGTRWLTRALALPATPGDREARARALAGLAELAWSQGDRRAARTYGEESVALWRRLDDRRGLALALEVLAYVIAGHGDHALAGRLYEENVALWRELGDERRAIRPLFELGLVEMRKGNRERAAERFEETLALLRTLERQQDLSSVLGFLSDIAWVQGDIVGAQRYLEEGVTMARQIEDQWVLCDALHNLAWFAGRQGQYAQAEALFLESLELARREQRREGWGAISWNLNHMGDVVRAQGDLERAAEIYEESLAMFREQDQTQGTAAVLHNLGHLALARGDIPQAERLFRESLRLFQDVDFTWSIADCLAGLGGVAAQKGRPERAAHLFGAAESIHRSLDASGMQVEPVNLAAWERDMTAARSQIDESAWAAAWQKGRTMSMEHAIDVALGDTTQSISTAAQAPGAPEQSRQ